MYFELISLIVYKGSKITKGHYYTYILNSDKKWYLLDDADTTVKHVTAKEVINQKKPAYILVYKKCSEDNFMRDRYDMIMDTYGKDSDKKIAVALDISISSKYNGKPNTHCKEIIKKIQEANCQNINDIRKFITTNKYKLNFWRYYNAAKEDHNKIYNSCVANGTCGFQLDFLIRERVQHGQVTPKDKNVYIYEPTKHLRTEETMDYFLRYLNTIITEPDHYFTNFRKPGINKNKGNNSKKNTYQSYDDWIYIRTKENKAKRIDDKTYHAELAYYKFYAAYHWIKDNPEFNSKRYPTTKMIKDQEINLWYSINMFHYTKQERKFSIYQDTSNQGIPYIPNYVILYYITKCEEYKYGYDEKEILDCLDIDNSGVLDKNHFYLYPIKYFSNSVLTEGLTKYFSNMNYVFQYGEFEYPDYEEFYRWGGNNIKFRRSYKIYPGESEDSKPLSSIFEETKIIDLSTEKALQELEKQELIAAFLADEAQELDDSASDTMINIDLTAEEEVNQQKVEKPEDHSNQAIVPSYPQESTNTEEKEAVNLLKLLTTKFMFMLKDNNYNNFEKVKNQTIELLNNNKEIILNNSILNPIITPDIVIDLTMTSNKIDSDSTPKKRKLKQDNIKSPPSSNKKSKK